MKRAVALAVSVGALAFSPEAHAEPDCEARVQFVHHALNRGAVLADRWSQLWQAGIAVVTVGQMGAIPVVGTADRVDLYVGGLASLAGLVPLAVMPPTVIDDAPRFEARLSEPDRCALAREGERLLERGAKSEATTTGVLAHVGNVAFNLGIGAILGFGFHHWTSAILNVALGTAIGETLILTYPAMLQKALARYRAGDLAPMNPPSRLGSERSFGLSFSF